MKAKNKEQRHPSEYRLSVLKKMEEYECLGLFDHDLEEDPPAKELRPEDITYIKKGPIAAIKRYIAYRMAYAYFAKEEKRGTAVVKDVIGAEKLSDVTTGAVITCNHFHPLDSFLMHYTFDESHRKGRMFRIIREGNYTSFPGFYGFLMRNCDTLPLSSNLATMRKFVRAVAEVLKDGHCVLIYPEQSLWWNYRKPKPMKIGGFEIAVKSNVPVVPCFITMEDCEQLDDEGMPVQAYTIHVGDPIYPDESLGKRDRAEDMRKKNTDFCRNVYESFYGIPLTYTTETKDESFEK